MHMTQSVIGVAVVLRIDKGDAACCAVVVINCSLKPEYEALHNDVKFMKIDNKVTEIVRDISEN